MEEKKYLKFHNKVAYGLGDSAANFMYQLVTSFVLVYVTDTMGMNVGIVGTLMMAAKIFDGITDLICGMLIDRTHSKMGKARPWMFYGQIGVSICLAALFSIPATPGMMQYVWFFIFYVALNAIFFTANNSGYATLSALATKNSNERVQLATFRYVFALGTGIVLNACTLKFVAYLGGGAAGWRTVAIIYAVIALVLNSISVWGVKELPEEELNSKDDNSAVEEVKETKLSFGETVKILASSKYFILCMLIQLIKYLGSSIFASAGVYYATYILGDENLWGSLSSMLNLPMLIILVFSPYLTVKLGSVRKLDFIGCVGMAIVGIGFAFVATTGNYTLLFVVMFLRGLCQGPIEGNLSALLAETADHVYKTKKIRMDGSVFSCSSFGIKVGSAIGSFLVGILMDMSGYISTTGEAVVQPASALNMITILFVVVPIVIGAVLAFLVYKLDVEKANREWDKAHAIAEN